MMTRGIDYRDCVANLREAIAVLRGLTRRRPEHKAVHEEVIAYLSHQLDQIAVPDGAPRTRRPYQRKAPITFEKSSVHKRP
ncbi:MAG: hypothetical protein FJX61_10560 [Alphaproteobacteria bacterium]|nr:hypothetical protein [Alphaproteobacteria bacterium]